MNKAELELWRQQPETKWLLDRLDELRREALMAPCLDPENPYRTHAVRATNEGRAGAFEEVTEMMKGE